MNTYVLRLRDRERAIEPSRRSGGSPGRISLISVRRLRAAARHDGRGPVKWGKLLSRLGSLTVSSERREVPGKIRIELSTKNTQQRGTCRMELYVYRYSKPSRKQEREPLPVPSPAPSHAVIPTPRLVSYSMAEEERDACQRSTQHYGKMMTGAGRLDDLMSELRASMMLLYARNHVWRVCASGAKTCMRARERVPKGSDVMFSLSLLGAPSAASTLLRCTGK